METKRSVTGLDSPVCRLLCGKPHVSECNEYVDDDVLQDSISQCRHILKQKVTKSKMLKRDDLLRFIHNLDSGHLRLDRRL